MAAQFAPGSFIFTTASVLAVGADNSVKNTMRKIILTGIFCSP